MSNRLTMIMGQALVATSLMFTACGTDVELCEVAKHPHAAQVKFTYDWRTYTVIPDSMYMIAYRVNDNFKSVMAINSENSFGRYVYNAPVFMETVPPVIEDVVTPEETPEETPGETPDDNTEVETPEGGSEGTGTEEPSAAKTRGVGEQMSAFDMKVGRYRFITFNLDTMRLDCSEITSFVTNNAESDNFWLEYKSVKKDDEKLKALMPNWKDFNDYADYIIPGRGPLYYTAPGQTLEAHSYNVEILPSRITQSLRIRFNISKSSTTKAPFVIDSVKAEISGVPYKFNLSNGYIDISKTYRALLDVDFIDANAEVIEDTPDNRYLRCLANINVPTIVNAESTKMTMGPGILQVLIYTHVEGETKANVIQSKINLYNTLTKAKLYSFVDEHRYVKRNNSGTTLSVSASLVIDGKKLTDNVDNGGGLDQWTSSGDIEIEL